jgi:hypothetical protein
MPASAGSFVHVPAGAVHAYQVDSETARILKSPPPNTNVSSLSWPPCRAQGSADQVDQERDFQRRRERFLHRLREGRGEG